MVIKDDMRLKWPETEGIAEFRDYWFKHFLFSNFIFSHFTEIKLTHNIVQVSGNIELSTDGVGGTFLVSLSVAHWMSIMRCHHS